ncbi:MAG: DNA polymerase III subunit epsilon [Hyphomonadaceae bacterium]|nr:DNA polymerase III subunit epsilon [Hyphomonadaceae bacterium]
MREIVFDTETTGRSPEDGDRIVEIGCVEIVNLSPTGRTFHCYLNPQRDVPDEVVRVHGLTGAFLRDKPLFASVVDELMEFFGDAPIIAHNAAFDRMFLNAELRRLQRAETPAERYIDSLEIARAKFRGAANSLDALSKRFMLDREGFDLSARRGAGGHGALVDAKMLARVYLELRGGREQSLVFEDAPVLEETASAIIRVSRAQRTLALPARITAEEAAAHAAFVSTLGADALWKKFAEFADQGEAGGEPPAAVALG